MVLSPKKFLDWGSLLISLGNKDPIEAYAIWGSFMCITLDVHKGTNINRGGTTYTKWGTLLEPQQVVTSETMSN